MYETEDGRREDGCDGSIRVSIDQREEQSSEEYLFR